ncbi:DMT family transporter [Aurantimonas sp. A2-1-M11]|uniref:DMT family transporter n=1 Tax=Aurantimonas sp. A2-1-M11 TaxID=3113712 RepID=UPI002F95A4AE
MSALSETEAAASARSYGQGLAIVGIGGLVLSFDIPLIRMSESSFWTVLAIRGLLTAAAVLLIWLIDRARNPRGQKLIAGRTGFLIVGIFSLAATTFVFAVFNTSAANVVFILAFNPMFAAILSWLLIGERPPLATVLAIPATLLGVLLIIGAGFETGNWTGDLSALATAFLIALALTLSRRSRTDMRYTAALGGLVPALVALPFMAGEGIQSDAIIWLVLNGGVLIPVAMICLAIGPMFVPAPVVSMAFLIETVLAPVWVWLIFAERPVDLAMLGGAVVVATLVAHSIAELRRMRRQRRPVARHDRLV